MKIKIVSVALVLMWLTMGAAPAPLPTPTPPAAVVTPPTELPALSLDGPGLAAAVSLLVSLALTYIPHLKERWEPYPYKREFLACFGFIVAWSLVGLHYTRAVDLSLGAFGWDVARSVVNAWLAYIGMAQVAYTAQRLTDT